MWRRLRDLRHVRNAPHRRHGLNRSHSLNTNVHRKRRSSNSRSRSGVMPVIPVIPVRAKARSHNLTADNTDQIRI